jgi:hypothetical protein
VFVVLTEHQIAMLKKNSGRFTQFIKPTVETGFEEKDVEACE